jgi:hypothetical protein
MYGYENGPAVNPEEGDVDQAELKDQVNEIEGGNDHVAKVGG